METHRIEGIKFNFDRLTDQELHNIHGHLLDHHARLIGEIALVEGALFARAHEELPFESGKDNYERVLGQAVMDGEITFPEAVEALDRYDNVVPIHRFQTPHVTEIQPDPAA